MRRVRLHARVAWLAAALLAAPVLAQEVGRVEGRVMLGVAGARLADVGPVVVYLEPVEGAASALAAARDGSATIRQQNAHFSPGFLAIAAGQTVDMPNDDEIYHNVFSYSKGNAFDLGLYAGGTTRAVRFESPGVVKIYCSIHESMNATVFAAPTPWFAVVAADGRFALADVPAGPWRLRTWCERLPDTAREVRVPAGGVARLDLVVGAPGSGSAAR